ncbi:uncharacterized protein METZ01_LOCUS378973, partial [marine metagenome]
GDTDVALVFRHLELLEECDLELFREFSEATGFRIYLQSSGPDSVRKMFPESAPNTLSYSVPEFDLTFQFGPMDFTQVNLAANREMISCTHKMLDLSGSDHVLDAFCGIG